MTGLLPQGVGGCVPFDHCASASSQLGRGTSRRCVGIMQCTRSVEAVVEAKKVDGANCTALLIPNPPDLTGRVAWLQLGLSLGKWMLVISVTMALR